MSEKTKQELKAPKSSKIIASDQPVDLDFLARSLCSAAQGCRLPLSINAPEIFSKLDAKEKSKVLKHIADNLEVVGDKGFILIVKNLEILWEQLRPAFKVQIFPILNRYVERTKSKVEESAPLSAFFIMRAEIDLYNAEKLKNAANPLIALENYQQAILNAKQAIRKNFNDTHKAKAYHIIYKAHKALAQLYSVKSEFKARATTSDALSDTVQAFFSPHQYHWL